MIKENERNTQGFNCRLNTSILNLSMSKEELNTMCEASYNLSNRITPQSSAANLLSLNLLD